MAEVTFIGPEGKLEGRIHISEKKTSPSAIFLAPHPQYGGTMNNKVVYTLFHAFARRGFSCLRFNYHGVGKSTGVQGKGEGEIADASVAIDFLHASCPESSVIWIIGFSFGAWIALQLLMRRPNISHFIAVAPPVNMFDFSFFSPCPTSGLIIQGLKDSIVPPQRVSALYQRINTTNGIQVTYKTFSHADHFFTKDLEELDSYIGEYLQNKNMLST